MARTIIVGISAFVALFVAVVMAWPSVVHLEREVVVAAPLAATFERVDTVAQWRDWGPWQGVANARVKRTPGARQVTAQIEFPGPWPGSTTATFVFTPGEHGTRVTWSLDADNDFFEKAAYLFLDTRTRASIRSDMERGLAGLKARAESAASQPIASTRRAWKPSL